MPLKNEHSDAIFNVDDDMKIPCDELTLGYHVWRNSGIYAKGACKRS